MTYMKKLLILAIFLFSVAFAFAQTDDSQFPMEEGVTYVAIETQYGQMVVKLYNETPLHRDNFVKLVQEGFYNDLLFHRVINQFMIQGGDPNSKNALPGQALGDGSLGYTIPAEFNGQLFHKKGALAAARMGDNVNPQKASSSCQFYLVQGRTWTDEYLQMFEQQYGKHFTPEQREVYKTLGGTPHLDGDYTVFGEVVKGLEIIDSIATVKTGAMDRPIENVSMKIYLVDKDKKAKDVKSAKQSANKNDKQKATEEKKTKKSKKSNK